MGKSKSERTLVTFLLDRTGSMETVKQETISGFNAYIDTLRAEKTPIDFTLVQFDSEGMDKVCVCEPIAKAPKLDDKNYQPRAATPLIDAAYKTIKAVEGQEKAKGAKIVICIQTDGQENSSHSHTWEQLKALIAEKQKLGWQFNFMGCGIDAYDQSAKMGLSVAQTMSYSPDAESTRQSFRAAASNTRAFAAGLSMNTNYTMAQKQASGDAFIHRQGPRAQRPRPQSTPLDFNESAPSSSDFSL